MNDCTADCHVSTSTPRTASISSPGRNPARSATEPGATSATVGRRPSTPIMYMHQYARIAKRKLNAGPAMTTAIRFGRDWRLNARWRSCSPTSPSDSSSILT